MFALLYKQNSDAGADATVRFYASKAQARTVMAAESNPEERPPSNPSAPGYDEETNCTVISKDGITIRDGIDTYSWEIIPAKEEPDWTVRSACEDQAGPLLFIRLSNVPAGVKYDALYMLDMWYGNTDQDTIDWAVEYQLWARMMFSDFWMVNPSRLDLQEVKEEFAGMLPTTVREAYLSALSMPAEEIAALIEQNVDE